MRCTCSDQWRALYWTAQGATPHQPNCPDRGRGSAIGSADPEFVDDDSMCLTDRIAQSVVLKMDRRKPVGKRVLLAPTTWWNLIRQSGAEKMIEHGPYGEFITLIVGCGRLYAVPDPNIKPGRYVFEGER